MKLGNLLAVAMAIGLFVTYVIACTTWWDLIGGIFTVSGAFAWLAFLANLLTEETTKSLKADFEAVFLNRRLSFLIPAGALGGLFLLVPARYGTLIIDGVENEESRLIIVRSETEDSRVEIPLAPHEAARLLQPTGFFNARRYVVEVSGLPPTVADIAWFERRRLSVPDDFLRQPAVLLRPSMEIVKGAGSPDLQFTLLVNGKNVELSKPYLGGAIWLGVGADVDPPSRLRQQWRSEFAAANLPELGLALWERPIAAGVPKLMVGDRVYAKLEWKPDDLFGVACGIVAAPKSPEDFPQELVLRKPAPGNCVDFAPTGH
jgi:hypothetical protein